jgi:hypothetical protein
MSRHYGKSWIIRIGRERSLEQRSRGPQEKQAKGLKASSEEIHSIAWVS